MPAPRWHGQVVLDWSRGGAGEPQPCALCQRPAITRSPKGVPCHKTCAEAWTATNEQDPTGQ